MNLLDFLLSLSKEQQDLICLAFLHCIEKVAKHEDCKM
jgi:hypothetical protein